MSRHRERPRQSIQKRASIVFASDKKGKKVAATSEREIGKGEMRFWAVGYRSYETPLLRSKRLTYNGLLDASVFSSLQTEYIHNKSFVFIVYYGYAGDFTTIILSVESVAEDFFLMMTI